MRAPIQFPAGWARRFSCKKGQTVSDGVRFFHQPWKAGSANISSDSSDLQKYNQNATAKKDARTLYVLNASQRHALQRGHRPSPGLPRSADEEGVIRFRLVPPVPRHAAGKSDRDKQGAKSVDLFRYDLQMLPCHLVGDGFRFLRKPPARAYISHCLDGCAV